MKRMTVVLLCLLCASCATYYHKNLKFNNSFLTGELEEAYHILTHKKKPKKKDRLLDLLNKGTVASMLGRYEESNGWFEEAYIEVEDLQKNYLVEGASFFFNPKITPYAGESFELLLIHYFKALNFLKLNEREKALVECKRMNIKLNELNDKYRSEKRYKRDAFIHMLMGIIYEVNGDFNNAFIAYRNAVNIYREDYLSLYGLNVPEQLKKDLLRTAHVMGFHSDVLFYEKELGLKYVPEKRPASEIIFLWHNGLGPVKTEWSVNFNIIRNQHARSVYFVNEEFGFNFHYSMDESEYRSSGLNDLQFIRVAFPKYIERTTGFSTGTLLVDGQEHELEKVQDLNAIAFRSLQDRFHIEMGKALLRFAIKKATELRLRKENQNLGAVVGIVNAISEQADTRHWQTLPHDIQYARVPVVPGKEQSVTIRTVSEGADQKHDLIFKLAPGETIFHSHHTISSRFPVR